MANIYAGSASENKKIILRFSGNDLKRSNHDLFEVYRILEIINAIELKDFDFVVYLIRNAKLSFKKDKNLTELLFILELIKNSLELNAFGKRSTILKRCKELFDPLFANDSAHMIFHYFDLRNWAEQKFSQK